MSFIDIGVSAGNVSVMKVITSPFIVVGLRILSPVLMGVRVSRYPLQGCAASHSANPRIRSSL
jgi:hypothetical protein